MQAQELYKGRNHAFNSNNMRLADEYCDVTIEVNGETIRAHKVILAANLKFFEKKFSTDAFQESEGVVTMDLVKKTDLELFLSYAYTGEILLTDSNALNLLELANYLSEDDIKEACIRFLKEHLKAEEACRAYKFADTIECLSLKNAAKAKITANFGECSKSADFLSFNPESLSDILSDGKDQSIQVQIMLFEGIMRWIWQDAKERKVCLEDLLSSIDISKLPALDIKSCLNEYSVNGKDEFGIREEVSRCHVANRIARKEREQKLVVIDADGYLKYYHFIDKQWSQQQQIPGAGFQRHVISSGAVFDDKLYYLNHMPEKYYLHVFDPSLNQVTRLQNSRRYLEYSRICASSSSIYICGGINEDGKRSNQCSAYHPPTDSFGMMAPMKYARSSPAAIFYQDCIYVLGGSDGPSFLDKVEKYDPTKNQWKALASMCNERCGHEAAVLGETLYVCGGESEEDDDASVEVYNPTTDSWRLVASMNKPRCNFLLVAHKGKLLAIGGTGQKTVEAYDPSKDQWQMDEEMSSGLDEYFYVGGLISPSCIANTK